MRKALALAAALLVGCGSTDHSTEDAEQYIIDDFGSQAKRVSCEAEGTEKWICDVLLEVAGIEGTQTLTVEAADLEE